MKNNCDNNQIKCSACALSKLCYPEGLSVEELAYLDKLSVTHTTLEKGDYLYQQGDAFERLFTVKVGSFKSFTRNYEGHEQIIGFYLPGELLGLESISAEQHVSSVMALEQSFVCEVSFSQLFALSSNIPSLQRRMLNLVSKTISSDISISVNSSARARVCSFLLNLSDRFKRRGLSATHLKLTMSREDIGNYLGLATETVSRMLNNLHTDKFIELSRRDIVLSDLRQLQIMSCETVK